MYRFLLKFHFLPVVALVAIISASNGQAALPYAVGDQPLPSLAPVLDEVMPSVVNIYTRTRVRVRSPLLDDPFFRHFFNVPDQSRERVSQSLGSGVIVDAERGYVLTNNHVIAGADDISVTLADGRSVTAELIGADPDTDLAMVRIEAEGLRAVPWADSALLRVGDFVVAVGNPFGLGQTVTSGIVSALGRTGFRGLEFQNFIQTDASINPGNSGGALINLRGELVGINSAIFTPSGGNVGIGFAIPSGMARYVMDQLAQFGEVRRGTLGIHVQDLTVDLAGAFDAGDVRGVLVAEVMSNSAADRAGLLPGDVIISVDNFAVRTTQDFYNVEGQLPIGRKSALEYIRKGRTQHVELSVAALQILDGELVDRRLAGARFEELPAKSRNNARVNGVLLAELEPTSFLARQGLRAGDLITGANRQNIQTLADFQQIIGAARGPILLQIRRNGNDYIARID